MGCKDLLKQLFTYQDQKNQIFDISFYNMTANNLIEFEGAIAIFLAFLIKHVDLMHFSTINEV